MIGIIGALSEEVEMLINMAEDKKGRRRFPEFPLLRKAPREEMRRRAVRHR